MDFKFGVAPLVILLYLHSSLLRTTSSEVTVDPKFSMPINNVTVPIGREAILTCVVQDLGSYKVAWLRVDTQTILTIQNHVITKNHRVAIVWAEKKTWQLKIKDIKESDRGWYMCQINTDPMKSQMGYLDVVVPPDILDYPTSTDMVVREGSNVTLKCAATGSPTPTITWRREGGESITLPGGAEVLSVEGSTFTISRVNRLHMGAYLCIASNGVPPTVSKRIMLIIHFPPMIWVQNQLVGALEGQKITLECQSEAYPKSINYWTREKGEIVPQGGKFEPVLLDNAYKVVMKLSIKSVSQSDFGSYKCVAKNSLGDTDGTIKLYAIPPHTVGSGESQVSRPRGKVLRKDGNGLLDANTIVDGVVVDGDDIALRGNNDVNYGSSASSKQFFHIFHLSVVSLTIICCHIDQL
ncbi:opioid-binding protein/cell adhesion molecule homolog [Lutzomyia longipalpis]|uniref:opioid-binding protein/cell adhesion molecule homolog n=1 Tax=Lutzomyia longipalpis TaxID=7200 RepID=UPI0024846F7A|nr:opioid-binding protein/cell adhesion molecule homolog [Lutzomyia longipalpis]